MKARLPLIAIFTTGLLLYGVILVFVLPDFQIVKYWRAAELLLKGQMQGERILDFSPAYLSLNVWLLQYHGTLLLLRWIQIVCTIVSGCLLFLLLRRFFPLALAFFGAIAFLFDRGLMIFTYTFEPEALLVVCTIAAVFLLSQQTDRSALLAGICFGLGMLTRPNFLPVVLIVPVYFLVNGKDRSWQKKTIFFLLPVMLCLSAAWIRNQHLLSYFTPVVMNPGTVFYEGNNPNSWGMSSIYPPVLNQVSENYTGQPDYHHQLYREFARRISGKNLRLLQVNSYWTNKSVHYLLENPSRACQLAIKKNFHIFHEFEWHDLATSYVYDTALRHSWIPAFPFALISALAIAGLLILLPEWKKYLPFYGFFFCQFFVMLLIYVSARQKLAILFLFIFFACGAVQYIFANRKRMLLLIFVLPFSLLLHAKTDVMKEEEHLWNNTLLSNQRISQAYQLRNRGEIDQAAAQSASALALTPWYFDSRRPANIRFPSGYVETALTFANGTDEASQMDRAILLMEGGHTQEAIALFERLQKSGYHPKRDDKQSSNFNFYLARCAWILGKKQNAQSYLSRGILESPGDPWLLSYLAAVNHGLESESKLDRYFDEIDRSYFFGKAYLQTDQPAEAAKHFRYVVDTLPEFRNAYIDLAAALGTSGNYEEGSKFYRKAIQMNPDPVFHEKAILNIFQQLAIRENTAFAQYSYGIVLRQFGYYEEALSQQEKATKQDPNNSQYNQEIATLKKIIERTRHTN